MDVMHAMSLIAGAGMPVIIPFTHVLSELHQERYLRSKTPSGLYPVTTYVLVQLRHIHIHVTL